jgi:hypothetical protein
LNPILLINVDNFFQVFLLGLVEFHTYDCDIEIDGENGPDENENDENIANPGLVFENGSGFLGTAVDDMVHVVRPSLESGKNEQTDQTLVDVLEVHIVVVPFSLELRNTRRPVYSVK